MGIPQRHLDQWLHNRKFVSLIPATHPDWIVTVSFYVALHAVDALLQSDGVRRVNSHDSRNEVLMNTRRYTRIWDAYQPLHDLSRRIRYLADPLQWITFEDIPKQVFRRYLYPIEESVYRLMAVPHTHVDIPLQKPGE